MNRITSKLLLILSLFVFFSHANQSIDMQKEQTAQSRYLTAIDGYTYAFPYVYMELLRYKMTNIYENDSVPYAPLNQFFHLRHLLDHQWQGGGMPNNDTLYSTAWVDVSKEPIILSHPDIAENRYFTFELAGHDSDNFDYVGTRTTGSKAGHFAIIGPDWQGELPEGVTALSPAHTQSVFIVGRTLVSGADDVKKVTALQNQYRLTPLSQWGKPNNTPASLKAPKPAATALNPATNPLGHWQTMVDIIGRSSERKDMRHMRSLLASLGIKPGVKVSELDDESKAMLSKAAVDAFAKLKQVIDHMGVKSNNWLYPSPVIGRAGKYGAYLLRASAQSLGGIVANDPEEAVYLFTRKDGQGSPLSGSGTYQIYFPKDNLPPVNSFWSVTAYNKDYNFISNEYKKYSVGDRTPGLKYDDQGGLTLYLQPTPPKSKELSANWLPTRAGQVFQMLIRSYLPKAEVIQQRWMPPAVKKTSK